MRSFFLLVFLVVFSFSGCSQPSETVPTGVGGNTSGVTDDGGELDLSLEAPPSSN